MTTNYERRIERLEEKLDQGKANRSSPEVQAYIEEVFSNPKPWTPPDWTDPNLYAHLEDRQAYLKAKPAMRRFHDAMGWPEWNGKEWGWPEYTLASGEQNGALARSYENAKQEAVPYTGQGPHTDDDGMARR